MPDEVGLNIHSTEYSPLSKWIMWIVNSEYYEMEYFLGSARHGLAEICAFSWWLLAFSRTIWPVDKFIKIEDRTVDRGQRIVGTEDSGDRCLANSLWLYNYAGCHCEFHCKWLRQRTRLAVAMRQAVNTARSSSVINSTERKTDSTRRLCKMQPWDDL